MRSNFIKKDQENQLVTIRENDSGRSNFIVLSDQEESKNNMENQIHIAEEDDSSSSYFVALPGQDGNDLENQTVNANKYNSTCANRIIPGLRNFFTDFSNLTGKAIPMAASYTFSIEQLAAGLLSLQLNNDEDHAAATVLFQTVMGTAIRVSLAPLFAVSIRSSSKFGALHKAEKDEVTNTALIEEKQNDIANTLKAGLIQSGIVTLPALGCLLFSEEMLKTFGQSSATSALAADFLKPFAVSAPALSVRMCLGQIMFANGDPKPAMIIGVINFGIGTGMSIWLAKGGLGISGRGLNGVAWGINVESYLTALGYAAYLFTSKKYAGIPFLNLSRTNWKNVKKELASLTSVAGPVTFTMAVETALTFMMGIFAGRLGVKEQAALSYSMQMVFLVFLGLMAYGQGTSLAVGRYKGEERYDMASRMAKNGLISTLIAVAPACVVVGVAPQLLYNILNIEDEETQENVTKLTPLILAGATAMAARYNVNQVLRSLGDHKGSTIISALGMASGILLAELLGLETDAAIFGVAAGLVIGEGVSLLSLLPRWFSRIHPEKIEAIHKKPALAEPQSWCGYFGSFFRCKPRDLQSNQDALLQKTPSITAINSPRN
jgi:Na+-driven multidrug efflux pump